MERRNNVTDSRYLLLSNECNLLKGQIASGGVCSGVMEQRLENASKEVDVSINDFNRHTTHSRKAV